MTTTTTIAARTATAAVGFNGPNTDVVAQLIIDITDVLFDAGYMSDEDIATMLRALANKVNPITHPAVTI